MSSDPKTLFGKEYVNSEKLVKSLRKDLPTLLGTSDVHGTVERRDKY